MTAYPFLVFPSVDLCFCNYYLRLYVRDIKSGSIAIVVLLFFNFFFPVLCTFSQFVCTYKVLGLSIKNTLD